LNDDKKKETKEIRENKDAKDEDPWDIPAFLRRRKK
jgi:hypothetical protein